MKQTHKIFNANCNVINNKCSLNLKDNKESFKERGKCNFTKKNKKKKNVFILSLFR